MIIDFPTIVAETDDIETPEGYILRRSRIVRTFWIRIIWSREQKTILLGRWRINFTSEPGASEYLEDVINSPSEPEWYEK